MTLEEYAVEKIKELENKKIELETALKSSESNYKSSLSSIKKLREENDKFKRIIGYYGSKNNNTEIRLGGYIGVNISDTWKNNNLTEEEQEVRNDFIFIGKIIKEYIENNPEPEAESKTASAEGGVDNEF